MSEALNRAIRRAQPSGTCVNCGKRPATVKWGDALAVTHGFAQNWCDVCAVSAQLDHAREASARVPKLERELAEALRRHE